MQTENKTELFLQKLMQEKIPVTVFLLGGVQLQGLITHISQEAFLLRRQAHTQLIFKHAVSTVVPAEIVEI